MHNAVIINMRRYIALEGRGYDTPGNRNQIQLARDASVTAIFYKKYSRADIRVV